MYTVAKDYYYVETSAIEVNSIIGVRELMCYDTPV